ncbi:bacillithiol biosynthesis deacetylase BshB1 [Ferruginibacter albus]|uniref:bacillithiol biosynthesis deacetylase BshB1 n=1 Tax=Ferruginibacter albus TaxID=2875540 RepID=UPI001CC5B563|nr:bacillithiol biosynthesis deacetylase BshB1 [Ferruginibacter albus]UAY53638.1 bacillithiol biosynthesis deacetylase BshB1 [Ferruginibacter albus]
MKLDILAFGSHPDDVELGCSGTLLVEKSNGKKTGIIDLTRGELGTRGSVETRTKEAAASANILQLDVRENLGMADGFFRNDEEHQRQIIKVLRRYQPEIILCNAPVDRHPDHGRASQLIVEAAFLSGLAKIETTDNNIPQAKWRPAYIFHYIQDTYIKPDFLINVSSVIDKKIESIKAFGTQFYNPENTGGPQTYISSPDFLDGIIHRNQMWGKMIGVAHAEGFISAKMIGFENFNAFIKKTT